jgi:hypothetical protein
MYMFFRGAAFFAGCYLAFQDYLGLEGYIAHCRDHWVQLSPIFGIAIAAVALASALRVKEK